MFAIPKTDRNKDHRTLLDSQAGPAGELQDNGDPVGSRWRAPLRMTSAVPSQPHTHAHQQLSNTFTGNVSVVFRSKRWWHRHGRGDDDPSVCLETENDLVLGSRTDSVEHLG